MTPPRELRVRLDAPLPREVRVGRGTAIFVCGWCFCPQAAIDGLAFELDGRPQPVSAFRMPRLDPFRELHPRLDPYSTAGMREDPASAEDPLLLGYRTGFWGMVEIGSAVPEGEVSLSLVASLVSGHTVRAELWRIALSNRLPAAPKPLPSGAPGDGTPLIAIAMATYNPPEDLLSEQIDSIRAQTHGHWVCVISDDASNPAGSATLRRVVADDPRFIIDRSPQRLGFYRNFERALSLVPEAAQFVALADQDDRWYPHKLANLLDAMGPASLVYSDARLVDREGRELAPTYWSTRRNNHSDLLSLLVANPVTGAASLMRREVLDYGLPFPPPQFAHYHDHWLALVAACLDGIAYVPDPLYDYVQHGTATLGHARANRMVSLGERMRRLHTRGASERIRKWRMHYFVDVARLEQFARILWLRLEPRMPRSSRREISRFLRVEHSPWQWLRLASRGVRELTGRPETLGAEWMLFLALLWRKLLSATARERPQRGLRIDALPPDDLAPRPGASAVSGRIAGVAAKIEPLDLLMDPGAPARVNLIVPAIDLDHFFGGYIGKFNLAARLAERGHRVRVVTADDGPPLPRDWRARLEGAAGLEGRLGFEIAFGRQGPLALNPDDSVIASTWWTAHIAADISRRLEGRPFLYLIQEYEPMTFPMGSWAALAEASYRLPHRALFSSELLRDYFRRHEIGVFSSGRERGAAESESFQNAIVGVSPPSATQLRLRRPRRLLFYARPEPHAARNMFELGALALGRALEDGALAGWELNGVGSQGAERSLELGPAAVRMLPRTSPGEYAALLAEHDLGLALMYTPHPSLVPIEMAAAGMLVVSNRFENKTPESLRAISSNLRAPEATVEDIAAALTEAAADVEDVEGRLVGSRVKWARDWGQALPDALLEKVEGFLRG